jgi:hypothetical protein
MNKDFGLILNLAAAVGARMPAADAAFEINARQSDEGAEQDFSAVILEMEKRAHLGSDFCAFGQEVSRSGRENCK